MICNGNNETSSRDFAFSVSTSGPAVASGPSLSGSSGPVQCNKVAQPGTFHSRVNISNFLSWCRATVGLRDTLLFETEDLVQGRNERNVVLCLLEVARRGARIGMPAPRLVQLEAEIDEEIRLGDCAVANGNRRDVTNGSSETRDVGVQTTTTANDAESAKAVPRGTSCSSSESICSSESSSRQHPTPSRTPRQTNPTPSIPNRRSRPVIEVDFMSLDEMVRYSRSSLKRTYSKSAGL